jgi:DNA polymerase III subunit delta'
MKIFGQATAVSYLTRGLKSKRLSPSLLFVGPDGVGKKTLALELAKALFCSAPVPVSPAFTLGACDLCDNCRKISEATHADVQVLNKRLQATILKEKESEQSALKIEAVRHLEKFLQLKSLEGSHRVVIIEDAHLLTEASANALLKTLEEPPENAQLVLLTQDEKSLPTTIMSRCAVVRFRRIPTRDLSLWLEQNYGLGIEEASAIAELADGSFSKALQIKDAEESTGTLDQFELDEFFDLLSDNEWKKEGKERAQALVSSLIGDSARRLAKGDLTRKESLQKLLQAQRKIEHHVSPRLVLESLYLSLRKRTS